LTSQPLTTHHLPPRYLISTLLNSVIAGPGPGLERNAPMVDCSAQLDFEGTAQGNERKVDKAVLVRRVMRAKDNAAPAVIHWVSPSVMSPPPPPLESWCRKTPSIM
jgi:hypothetical protein